MVYILFFIIYLEEDLKKKKKTLDIGFTNLRIE